MNCLSITFALSKHSAVAPKAEPAAIWMAVFGGRKIAESMP